MNLNDGMKDFADFYSIAAADQDYHTNQYNFQSKRKPRFLDDNDY